MCGLIDSDIGNAYISGYNIAIDKIQAYSDMGVCPQFDNHLCQNLTGKEHLILYGEIRGLSSTEIEEATERLLDTCDLKMHANKLIKNYSGGNKRKLSLALTLISSPKVIFLDEPSTGMDPVTKRKMWDILSELKKKHAILLTTHSMEEADALCTRIGIMVSGSLRCLGSSQHLKDKYGSTYSLSLKTNESNVSNLSEFVKKISLMQNLYQNFREPKIMKFLWLVFNYLKYLI